MAKLEISGKRLAISKANAQTVAIVAAAAFITVFCLMASRTVWSTNQYQARVTKVKEAANDQLKANLEAFDKLSSSYRSFDNRSLNVIGGQRDGTGDSDGRNTRIILDALPPSYDFPALASSLEKILSNNSYKIGDITGTDDQVNQQTNISSPTPKPVPIPFSFTLTHANYESTQKLIDTLQHSVRPIQIDAIDLSGSNEDLSVTITAHTYYQPATSLTITKQVVQ